MMITFNAVLEPMCRRPFLASWCKALIIGAALLGLAGCSSIRLAYSNAPTLSWWWLDGYADFDRSQAGEVRAGIDRLFDWHRSTQLPEYALLLADAQRIVGEDITAATACSWQDRVRALFDPTVERAITEAAELLPLLTEAQFQHIEQRNAKRGDEMRSDFLQPDPAERLRVSTRRVVDRAERLYGRLNAEQRALVAEQVQASPFDPALWIAERERRQQATLAALRQLSTTELPAAERAAGLRQLVQRMERSSDADHRDYQRRLAAYNCAFAARVHNATTPAQRERALGQLLRWQEDLRALSPADNG
jgi:hypothetical protein